MFIYPTITDYLNAIENNLCFNKLQVTFLKNENDELIYYVGNNSLILKVSINNTYYSLKLYTSYNKQREEYFKHLKEYTANSKNITLPKFNYLQDEINVYINGKFNSYPVLVTEWIEGATLSECVKRYSTLGLKDKLHNLVGKFLEFSLELQNSEITHIDLKPENIIVTETDDLRLIDIDALYLPNYSPSFISEQGTVWYKHPLRKEYTYAKYLHDYPILVILASLLALEEKPNLYELYSNGENLIFSPSNILKNKDKAYCAVKELFQNSIHSNLIETLASRDVKIQNIERILHVTYYIHFNRFKEKLNDTTLFYFEEFVNICEDIYGIKYAGLWSFSSKEGKMLTPFSFSKINRASEGKIVLYKDTEWCVYSLNLTLLSTFEAEDATFFNQGLLPIKRNGKWKYLNNDYRELLKIDKN